MSSIQKDKGISVFFPLRSGSQRVLSKNTRPFSRDGMSLFEKKLNQLLEMTDSLKEILISTDDDSIINYCKQFKNSDKIKCIRRPVHLCNSHTPVSELIDYVPKVVSGEIVLWVHATSPFIDSYDYQKAINQYFDLAKDGLCDSVMSVNKIQQFIWSKKENAIINNTMPNREWPNTQDLEPWYEINHAFYLNPTINYLKYKNRIGLNPHLYVCEGVKKIDIDEKADFILAQSIESALYK